MWEINQGKFLGYSYIYKHHKKYKARYRDRCLLPWGKKGWGSQIVLNDSVASTGSVMVFTTQKISPMFMNISAPLI